MPDPGGVGGPVRASPGKCLPERRRCGSAVREQRPRISGPRISAPPGPCCGAAGAPPAPPGPGGRLGEAGLAAGAAPLRPGTASGAGLLGQLLGAELQVKSNYSNNAASLHPKNQQTKTTNNSPPQVEGVCLPKGGGLGLDDL